MGCSLSVSVSVSLCLSACLSVSVCLCISPICLALHLFFFRWSLSLCYSLPVSVSYRPHHYASLRLPFPRSLCMSVRLSACFSLSDKPAKWHRQKHTQTATYIHTERDRGAHVHLSIHCRLISCCCWCWAKSKKSTRTNGASVPLILGELIQHNSKKHDSKRTTKQLQQQHRHPATAAVSILSCCPEARCRKPPVRLA